MKQNRNLKIRADGRYKCTYHGHCFYGKTSDEAFKKRDEYKRLVEEGMQTHQIRVQDYATKWLPIAKVNIRPHTYNGYAKMLEYLNKEIGFYYLNQVKPTDIKRVYSKHYASLSDSHIKHAKNLYTAMFDAAMEDGYIRINPCRSRSAKPHKGKHGSHREITDEERRLIETTEHPLRPLVMTMLYAGLRNSEALALDVDRDVDFERKYIHVQHFLHLDTNTPTIDTTGKNQNANRYIKLFPHLETVLSGLHGLLISMPDGSALTKSAWISLWHSYVNTIEKQLNGCQKRWYGKRKIDLNHQQMNTRLLSEGNKSQDLQFCLSPWKSFNVLPYDLRHSFATYCRDLEIDIVVCMHWMGHSDPKMILDIYDHFSPKREEKEYKKIILAYQHEKRELQTIHNENEESQNEVKHLW